ncbi:MAG: hypothetical protein IRY99_12865 [Isosphaeraceae bacterium]|nr:hypothetical protein [Isosphaeraceae bacterium]
MQQAHGLDEVGRLGTIRAVLRWALAQSPPAEFVAAVAMDEFTHDIIVCAGPDLFLVFDTT